MLFLANWSVMSLGQLYALVTPNEETANGFSISRKNFDTYIADEEAPNFTQTKFSSTNRYISTVQVQ